MIDISIKTLKELGITLYNREGKMKPLPILIEELKDETSVPKIFYKDEEIKAKVNVSFDWETSDAHRPSGLSYAIEHHETGNGQATINRIERRCGDHAFN